MPVASPPTGSSTVNHTRRPSCSPPPAPPGWRAGAGAAPVVTRRRRSGTEHALDHRGGPEAAAVAELPHRWVANHPGGRPPRRGRRAVGTTVGGGAGRVICRSAVDRRPGPSSRARRTPSDGSAPRQRLARCRRAATVARRRGPRRRRAERRARLDGQRTGTRRRWCPSPPAGCRRRESAAPCSYAGSRRRRCRPPRQGQQSAPARVSVRRGLGVLAQGDRGPAPPDGWSRTPSRSRTTRTPGTRASV